MDTTTPRRHGAHISRCDRCGRNRQTPYAKKPGSCIDCKTVTFHTAAAHPEPLTGGTWVRRNLIWRWVPDPADQDAAA